MIALLVALAGGLGAVARFQSDAAIARLHKVRMPLGTLHDAAFGRCSTSGATQRREAS